MYVFIDDIAIIERALHAAILNSTDYEEIDQFESVLKKLKKNPTAAQQDGFRYDYNDNSYY
ncbi:hypothetical protein WQ54_08065 [Bacillus sp. SA1-12]|nr:hypothetical protein WQ54_08065 [Bacillus sp. SA1-12]